MNQISERAVIHDGVVLGDNIIIKDYAVIYPGVHIADNTTVLEGAIIGRLPLGAKAVARKPVDHYSDVYIGEYCVISSHAVIYTDVRIGAGTLVGDAASIREQCSIGDNCIISRHVTVNYNTTIGNKTKIMDGTHITGNMKIGDNVFISTLVATTNDNNIGRKGYDDKEIIGPTICNNASIGAGANILPNVILGEGCIVGAGAVVTKDVPPFTLVMGIPAKVIREL